MKRLVDAGRGVEALVEHLPADRPEVAVTLPGRARPLAVRLRPPAEPPPAVHPAAVRLLAVSDVEGNLDALVALLRAGGVVDGDLAWTFGEGRLVVVGDVFDRGLHVTECLWLLYELEARARAAGGGVHLVLGNHELMNLTGDLRYVRNKYRENAALLGERLVDLFSRRTVLGRWLRTRNVIERIGEEVYVHGGIAPGVAQAGVRLEALNDALRTALLAEAWNEPTEGPLALAAGSPDGLLWYRGYVQPPLAAAADVDAALAAFGAKRVVVGHTIVPQVAFAFDGRVLTLDVHHAGGTVQAALLERGTWYRLTPDGRRERL